MTSTHVMIDHTLYIQWHHSLDALTEFQLLYLIAIIFCAGLRLEDQHKNT